VTDDVAGAKTPGALSTPIAPSTGTGLAGSSEADSVVLGLAGVIIAAGGLAMVRIGPRKRS
jgi:hypothetical protein